MSQRRLHKLTCPFERVQVMQSRELVWELCHLLPAQTYVRRCLHMYAYAMLPKRTSPSGTYMDYVSSFCAGARPLVHFR